MILSAKIIMIIIGLSVISFFLGIMISNPSAERSCFYDMYQLLQHCLDSATTQSAIDMCRITYDAGVDLCIAQFGPNSP